MVFSLSFCRLSMPPKRSSRVRNASAWAAAIAVQVCSCAAESDKPRLILCGQHRPFCYPLQHSTSWATTHLLSPGILDQLVPWMADTVTRRLSSPNETSTTPINNTSRPSALSEVLLVFQPTSTRQWCPIAWYISCNSTNGWCHSAWIFKHHTSFIVRWFPCLTSYIY